MAPKKKTEPVENQPEETSLPVGKVPLKLDEINIVPDEVTQKVVENFTKHAAKQLTDAELNKSVRVQNAGAPFLCDLTAFGYGTRWPTKAIYVISVRKYIELLEQGFNGSYV